MAQPFDYTPQLQNPLQGAMQAIQLGMTLRDDRAQQAQAQAKAEQARLLNADLLAASNDPNPGAIAKLSLKYPQLSEGFKRSYDMMTEDARQSNLSAMTQVYSAVNAEQPALAVDLLRKQSEAMKAAGKEREAQASTVLADLIEKSPQHAKLTIGTALSGVMGPDKFAETFAKLGGEQRSQEQAPADLETKQAGAAKAASEAKTAAITAQYADSKAIGDLQKNQWDITKIVQDIGIAKEQNRIRAMEVATAKEGNALKREEQQLKIDEAKRARDESIRKVAAEAESSAATIDNMMNTIQKIKASPGLREVIGSIEGSDFYPTQLAAAANALNPFTSGGDERANAIALIDTLGNQAFLAQVKAAGTMSGLTEKEGEKLQNGLQNLKRKQGEQQFIDGLDELTRIAMKARENLSKKTGVPLPKPDTPAAPGARKPLSAFDGGAVTLDPRSGVPTLPGP